MRRPSARELSSHSRAIATKTIRSTSKAQRLPQQSSPTAARTLLDTDCLGDARSCQLTTHDQPPGPQDAWIATGARWPRSLQRTVGIIISFFVSSKTNKPHPCQAPVSLTPRKPSSESRNPLLHDSPVMCDTPSMRNKSQQIRQAGASHRSK